MDLSRAKRLSDMVLSPGWKDAKAIISDIKQEVSEELDLMLDRKPDLLTGKKAFSLSGQRKGLNRFEEEVESALRLLLPNRKAGDTGGKT